MQINALTLAILLGVSGVRAQNFACFADLNADGVVAIDDLLALLATYGRTASGCSDTSASRARGAAPEPSDFRLPGNFATLNNSLETEPRCVHASLDPPTTTWPVSAGCWRRLDPRFLEAFRAAGMSGLPADPGISLGSSREAIQGWTEAVEPAYQFVLDSVFYGNYSRDHPVLGVERELAFIEGDGCHPSGCGEHPNNSIPLFVVRPTSHDAPSGDRIPCVVSIHGGGMTFLRAGDRMFEYERDRQAAAGMVVIGPDFRNAGGLFPEAPHLFPKGLHDVYSTVQWYATEQHHGVHSRFLCLPYRFRAYANRTHERREELGCSSIITSGCSGGGNLATAVSHYAKQVGGPADMLDGVFACAPYIAGPQIYNEISDDWFQLPSLYENDHLFLDVDMLAGMSWV